MIKDQKIFDNLTSFSPGFDVKVELKIYIERFFLHVFNDFCKDFNVNMHQNIEDDTFHCKTMPPGYVLKTCCFKKVSF